MYGCFCFVFCNVFSSQDTLVSQEGEGGGVDTWREWSGGDTQGWPVGRERGEVGRWREQGIQLERERGEVGRWREQGIQLEREREGSGRREEGGSRG